MACFSPQRLSVRRFRFRFRFNWLARLGRFARLGRTTRLGRIGAVLLGCGASVMCFAVGLSAANAQENIQQAEALQEELDRERVLATDGIAYLNAQNYAIVKGHEEATAALEVEQAKINALMQSLGATSSRQEQLGQQVAELELRRDELAVAAMDLAVQRYIRAGVPQVELLLASEDLGDDLALLALTETLLGGTNDAMSELRAIDDDLSRATEQEAALQAEIERLNAEIQASLPELEVRRAEWDQLEDQYSQLLSEWRSSLARLDAEDQRLAQFIQQKRVEEEIQRKLAELSQSGGNGFVRPAQGAISSGYGNRLHPILNYHRLHAGVDFTGNTGDRIIAARNGVVILAQYSGAYGYTVILDHGDGFTTLYAHLSSYNVSVGDTVEAGTTIGAMGSTGLSTGPHLHFEIRKDGVAVDPLPYL